MRRSPSDARKDSPPGPDVTDLASPADSDSDKMAGGGIALRLVGGAWNLHRRTREIK